MLCDFYFALFYAVFMRVFCRYGLFATDVSEFINKYLNNVFRTVLHRSVQRSRS